MKVTIIIPAYNVEEYIERCLQSCVRQNYDNWEAIIINDGSRDATLAKIREYQKIDSRIKFIDKNNEGLAKARKDGLEKAEGDYIYFLDSDDFLYIDSISECLNIFKENDVDIVIHDMTAIWDSGKQRLGTHNITQNISGLEVVQSMLTSDLSSTIWGKMYKKSVFDSVSHPVDQRMMGEDTLLLLEVALKNEPKIFYLKKPLYYYYQRVGSITKQGNILGEYMVQYAIAVEEKLRKYNLLQTVNIEWSKFNLDVVLRILLDKSVETPKISNFIEKVIKVNYKSAKHLLTWKRKLIIYLLKINYNLAIKVISSSK
ncbi:glycosyltransferase family 2 protein [Chryseobacterium foetidum]|uniref:glycosyltransferase family 2 protein n=1 Tax=Chryseobacterium foetidum TaxID=2951057 RepID=UPI0021C9D709|nr:glycosyltransferase family 2 protein [Chryseobacterium foetidum]